MYILFICVVWLIASIRLGVYVRREVWQGHGTDVQHLALRQRQVILLGVAWILIGIIVALQSLRIDLLTLVSLGFLAVSVFCAIGGLWIGRYLRQQG